MNLFKVLQRNIIFPFSYRSLLFSSSFRFYCNNSNINDNIPSFRKDKEDKLCNFSNNLQNREKLYPPLSYYPTYTIKEFINRYNSLNNGEEIDNKIILCGRIISKRLSSKKLVFFDINSNGSTIQVMISKSSYTNIKGYLSYDEIYNMINRGDIIGIHGIPKKTNVGQLSIKPESIQLLAPCFHSIPAYYGLKDIENRYRKRYLDIMINSDVRERFIIRSKIISFIRNYLENNEYIEVETPILWSDAGGANATPFETQLKALDENIPLYLRVAPELFLKMLVVGGMERVYELGKQFRNEGIDATHNPEFTTCEFYRAYADYNHMLSFVEQLFSQLVIHIHGKPIIEFNNDIQIDFTTPFTRIDIMSELEKKIGIKLPDPNTENSIEWDNLCTRLNVPCSNPRTTARLLDKLIGHYLEPECINPTFLINHPQILSPLAKQHRDPLKKGLTERFELFINGMEISNAYTELNDPLEQLLQFNNQLKAREQGDTEAQPSNKEFVEALEYGLPPTTGCGIGIDRLIMLLCQVKQIREVICFPLLKLKKE